MRYTTVIDITEIPDIWRNPNVCRLYFYMALKCGYHDNDRDVLRISLRNLAYAAGLTLSATRHALRILLKHQLVSQNQDAWIVRKFLLDQAISPRAKQAKSAAAEAREHQQQQLDKRLDQERRYRMGELDENPAEFIRQYEEYLQDPSNMIRKAFLTRWKGKYEELKARV